MADWRWAYHLGHAWVRHQWVCGAGLYGGGSPHYGTGVGESAAAAAASGMHGFPAMLTSFIGRAGSASGAMVSTLERACGAGSKSRCRTSLRPGLDASFTGRSITFLYPYPSLQTRLLLIDSRIRAL
jgi:hypothetical protein